jgi:Concanavalin A-like lectin/glucanases superfamily
MNFVKGLLIAALLLSLELCAYAQSCTQPPSGLVAWWPGDGSFDDIQGTNPGTNAGGTTFTTGEVGQAFHFTLDSNSYVVLPNSPELTPANQMTIEAWIKPDYSSGNEVDTILQKRDGCGSNRSYTLLVQKTPGNGMTFSASVASDDAQATLPVPNDGRFHHIAGTYDGAVMDAYMDGVLVAQKAHTGPILTTTDPPYMGLHSGCGQHSTADIDEIKLYNRALTQQEISTIVQAGSAGQCKTAYTAAVQQPINPNGSSVFKASRGAVPIKFTLRLHGEPTCELPPATISLTRLSGTPDTVDESVYIMPSDTGSDFRISGCQYIYNLGADSLGVGDYQVQLNINGFAVGSGNFGLK